MNKLRLVKEVLPQKREVGDWSEEKIASFVRFALFFTVPYTRKGKPDHKFEVTEEKWLAARNNKDEEFWPEFCLRVNKTGANYHVLKLRLMMATRTVLGWLKSNPYAITEELETLMKDNPRTAWALSSFKTTKTAMGNEVVVADNRETTDVAISNVAPTVTNAPNPEVQYRNAVLRMASILNSLTKGIRKSDIDMMSAKDKITMAVNLTGALTRTFKTNNVNNAFFKTLIINQSGRKELEESILDYTSKQGQ